MCILLVYILRLYYIARCNKHKIKLYSIIYNYPVSAASHFYHNFNADMNF